MRVEAPEAPGGTAPVSAALGAAPAMPDVAKGVTPAAPPVHGPSTFRPWRCSQMVSLRMSGRRFALQPQFSEVHGKSVFNFFSVFIIALKGPE